MNKNRPATCFINRAEVTPFAKSRVPPISGNDMNSDGVVTSVHGNDPSNCGLDYLFHCIDIMKTNITKELAPYNQDWVHQMHFSGPPSTSISPLLWYQYCLQDLQRPQKLQTHKAVVIWITLLRKSSSCERNFWEQCNGQNIVTPKRI